MGGAQLAGELQPFLHHVYAEQWICPDEAAELQRQEADDAQPVHGRRFADLNLGAAHTMQRDVTEHAEGDFDVRQIIRHLVDAKLLRDGDFLGFERRRYQPVRCVVAAADHAVPDDQAVDFVSHSLDHADRGVAEPGRLELCLLYRAGRAAGSDAIHLRTGADLGEVRAHEYLIRRGDRHFELFDFNLARGREDQPLSI